MGRLRVKDLQPSDNENRRHTIWSLIDSNKVNVYKVQQTGDAYAIVASDAELEKLLTTECRRQYSEKGFELYEPPHLKSKRTIVLLGVDDFVSDHSNEEIQYQLENDKAVKVVEVIRIPNVARIIKVRLETTVMATNLQCKGLSLFGQHFGGQNNIQIDTHVYIPQCIRCYEYDHLRKNCPKSTDYKVCSKCGTEGHRYLDCHSVFTKCLSCQGDHPTMAARCPIRKNYTQEKGKELRDKEKARNQVSSNYSYAQATATNKQQSQGNVSQQTPPSATPWTSPPQHQLIAIHTALMYANMREAARPGTFQSTFDRIMEANGLPKIIFPMDVLDAEAIQNVQSTAAIPAQAPSIQDESNDMDMSTRLEKRSRTSDSLEEVQENTSEATDPGRVSKQRTA